MVMGYKRLLLLVFVVMFLQAWLYAQDVTFQSALSSFEKGAYPESAEAFSKLLQKSNRDAKLNYYYGAALVESNQNLSEAIKRLKFAQLNKGGADVAFFQGRAAQLNYEFEQAIDFYTRYLKLGKNKGLVARANSYLKQCQASVPLSAKIFDIKVLSRQLASRDNFVSYYHPGKDVGAILPNSTFFESGVDPNGLLFKTERGDAVYYARANDSGQHDLFQLEKLIDGWGEPLSLDELNSNGNDQMPFLMLDGVTLYFASDRDGGMGGLDIYKSTYDMETRLYSEPVNLGVPFNSPFDDFLFVADEFKNVAWFASNRHAPTDSVEVFQILWDGSVIRNLAMNTDEIRKAARLEPDSSLTFHPANDNRPFVADKRIAKPAELFRFVINDTLTYTDWSHFRNDQAKAEFEKGFALSRKKDSLNDKMLHFRRLFSSTNDEAERNQAVNEILKMEREVYSIDELVERHYIKARLLEINYLKEHRGELPPASASAEAEVTNGIVDLDKLLIPSKFTYYTDDEFERQLTEWSLMYARLFDSFDGQELHRADSLYVWGNILTLEASRLNEQILKSGATVGPGGLFQGGTATESTEELKQNSKLYKATALNLYHQTLDTKFRLFTDKINQIRMEDSTLNLDAMMEKQVQALSYYKKATDLAPKLDGSDFELYEKAGTYKRQAVALQTDALFLYLHHLDGTTLFEQSLPEKAVDMRPAKEERVMDQPVQPAHPKQSVEQASSQAEKPEYRIQLGVFKNQPNPVALSQLPAIRKAVLESGQATRYYCGQFKTYEEAAKFVPIARELGFTGAFVVAFLKEEQISVAKAKELE